MQKADQKQNSSSLIMKILKKCMFFLDMKRRYKVLSFFALLFVVAYFCTPSLETVVKKLVHQYGSQVTGTDVSIDGFKLSLTDGQAAVRGIKIGNPKGYKAPNLFNLQEISVGVDLKSLTSDTIVIKSINIDSPAITYEMLSLTQNNVSDILNNIQANTASSEPKAETKPEPKKEDNAQSKKVIIKKLTVSNGQVGIMAGMGDFKKELTVPLPTITMSNIGEEKQGASISEILSEVITKILNQAQQTAVSGLMSISDLGAASKEGVKNVTDNLKDGAGKAADNIKGSLGGLFK